MADLFKGELQEETILRANGDLIVDRAITLTQPWATLMAFGYKWIETRGRPSHYRGWVAIHAAKGFPDDAKMLCLEEPFASCLKGAGYASFRDLPLGKVLSVTQFKDCAPTDEIRWDISGQERAFGNYGSGRYGIVTSGPRRLREPFELRGFQSIPWKMPRTITEADLLK